MIFGDLCGVAASPIIRGSCTECVGNVSGVGCTFTFRGIAPMLTPMKSTHESVPFKHSVVRLYSSFMLNMVMGCHIYTHCTIYSFNITEDINPEIFQRYYWVNLHKEVMTEIRAYLVKHL